MQSGHLFSLRMNLEVIYNIAVEPISGKPPEWSRVVLLNSWPAGTAGGLSADVVDRHGEDSVQHCIYLSHLAKAACLEGVESDGRGQQAFRNRRLLLSLRVGK